MKKSILAIMVITAFSTQAENFNVIIKKDSGFESKPLPIYTDTGNERCNIESPLDNQIYKDTSFTKTLSDCEKEQSSPEGYTRWVSTEDKTENSIGTLVLNSCENVIDNGHSRGNDIYTVNYSGTEESVYCNMTIDDGGWMLAAIKAHDNNEYWTWNNRATLRDGSTTGSLNEMTKDYQGNVWNNYSANQLLITPMDQSKALRYDSVLSNQAIKTIYPNSNVTSNTFTADNVIGSWWKETGGSTQTCDTGQFYMRTKTPDSDSHGWAEGSIGFIWMSQNNDIYSCWDDTFGGLSSAMSSYVNIERSWTHGDAFYKNNFSSTGGMFVFVK